MRSITRIACLLAMIGTASAQNGNPNQAEADKFFAEGRKALTDKEPNPILACEKFEHAIALDPTAPGVMLNLGLCYEMQEKFATSLYWFRKAQFAAAEAKPNPLPEYEEAAKSHTKDLANKVAIARIDVSQAPPGVRVSIDGRPVRSEDYLRLEVDSDSVVEARSPGKDIFRQKVEVEGQAAKDIVIILHDETVAPMLDPGKGRRRLAYIVGAGGVLIWGLTLTYGLVVRSRYDTIGDGHYEEADGFDNAKHDLQVWGTTLFVAGTATVGVAVFLYLTAPKPHRERKEQALVPIVTPDHVGFGYTRSF